MKKIEKLVLILLLLETLLRYGSSISVGTLKALGLNPSLAGNTSPIVPVLLLRTRQGIVLILLLLETLLRF